MGGVVVPRGARLEVDGAAVDESEAGAEGDNPGELVVAVHLHDEAVVEVHLCGRKKG